GPIKKSKMGFITTSVGFYDLHAQHHMVQIFKRFLDFSLKQFHDLVIIPKYLSAQWVFEHGEPRCTQPFNKMYDRGFKIVLEGGEGELYGYFHGNIFSGAKLLKRNGQPPIILSA